MHHRLESALTLYAFAVLGVFLLISPWTPVWERAAVALAPKSIHDYVLSGWARGGVSGLGGLDLAVAGQLVAQFLRRGREERRAQREGRQP